MKCKPDCFAKYLVSVLVVLFIPFKFASAQDSDPEIEEIVVTANKRGEVGIQDIAGSIQAIGSDVLEDLGAEGFEDYIKLVPGLTSVSSGTGQSQIVIRGVNSGRVDHQAVQAKSLAGLYIDDTPISLAGFNPDLGLLDVERVEILRGPQGTLYGASSMSGTVRIITKKPDTEKMSGKMSANFSHTHDGDLNYGVNGTVNIPLSDRMAMKLGAYYIDRDGFIDNIAPGGEDDYNSEDMVGVRGALAWYGDIFSATGTFMYNKLDADGRPDENDASLGELITTANERNAGVTGQPLFPSGINVSGELQAFKPARDEFENEFVGGNIRLEWNFEHFNVVSSTSYFDSETVNRVDEFYRGNLFLNGALAGLGGTGPGPIGGITENTLLNNTDQESIIEEFRVSSTDEEDPWRWVLGFYYEDSDRLLGPRTLGGPGLEEQLIAAGHIVHTASPDSIIDTREYSEIEQMAFFGEIALDVIESVEVLVGARLFDYEAVYEIHNNGQLFGRPNQAGMSDPVVSLDENDWLAKGQLTWRITDDLLVYGTYSEGFRLGGGTDIIGSNCNDELAALGVPPGGGTYRSDTIDSIEGGAKTSWMGGRVRANLAVYHIEWKDIQQTIGLECGFSSTMNLGAITSTGVEGDISMRPADNLGLTFGFAYVDAEVDEVPDVPEPPNQLGDTPPYVADFTASGSIVYDGIRIGSGQGFVRADVRHVGSSYNEFTSSGGKSKLGEYTIVDLTLGYDYGSWTYSLFARNLFDESVITNIDPDRAAPIQYTRSRPRTIGMSVTRHFD